MLNIQDPWKVWVSIIPDIAMFRLTHLEQQQPPKLPGPSENSPAAEEIAGSATRACEVLVEEKTNAGI